MPRRKKTLEDLDFPDDWEKIVFDMSAKGCSEVEIRAKLLLASGSEAKAIHRMWNVLQKRDKEFCQVIKIAKTLCQAWWERVSRESLHDKCFQTGSWYANMKNRFNWRDKPEVDTDSEFINQKIIIVDQGGSKIKDRIRQYQN